MKLRIAAVALAAVAVIVLPLAAQTGSGPHGKHDRSGGGPPVYDLAGETTLTGTVAEVLPQSCPRAGIHLRLTTATGDVEVGLGPTTFLAELGAGFQPKNDAPADFLARTVKKGDTTYELRDAEGAPRWAMAGGGRGAGQGCAMKGSQGRGQGHGHGAKAHGGKGCGCCQGAAASS